MYAVIQAGGRQYKVQEGDTIRVDFFDAPVGAQVTFDRVLITADGDAVKVGHPTVDGATVVGEVKAQARGEKISIFRRRRRHQMKKRRGFRAQLTEVRIARISA